ncbi:hypothetical protein CK500_02040 [Halorubrum salipaludis]|uniref:VWFA domain-containing protein n=1 Tax=Halorubrum salipaludis TaxID=2032630 RepID=A0A2A2FL34_9EURY|nr:VWA domain-containing protein [Halorubrum salipaludis]PAU85474.1 hypothetical protein CK500_02040 [Halorubrum salipaludis]
MNPDTTDTIGLSRRKLLAGLGAVGVASAGAGLGTTAYFNDTETFEGNTLTAGELDLKLDYRATYAGGTGRIDEINGWYSDEGPGEPFDVVEEDDGVYLVGEVPNIDEGEWPDVVQERDFCAPDVDLVNGDEIPVFVLDDVKPGDCGEVTISLHICDNPSWVWMNGELTADDENTVSEPEAGADGESNALGDDGDGPISGQGELADAIDVTMWYDEDCDNVYEPGGESGGPLCVQIVLDASGSMSGARNTQAIEGAKTLAESILQDGPTGSRVGVTFFSAAGYSSGAQVVQPLTDDLQTVLDTIDDLPADGSNTAIGEGIETAQGDLENCDEGESPTMVVLTDGSNNAGTSPSGAAAAAKGDGTTIYALGVGGAEVSTLNAIASDPDEDYVFFASDEGALEQAFGLIGESLLGESIIFEGSLADAMAELEAGIALDGNRATEARDPFDGGLTQCIGFEWCLPTDVGNEVQTDSVAFDLGFYAEQSRHNDEPDVTFNGTVPTSNSTGNASQ